MHVQDHVLPDTYTFVLYATLGGLHVVHTMDVPVHVPFARHVRFSGAAA
jgi:hypothetical protein